MGLQEINRACGRWDRVECGPTIDWGNSFGGTALKNEDTKTGLVTEAAVTPIPLHDRCWGNGSGVVGRVPIVDCTGEFESEGKKVSSDTRALPQQILK